MEADLPTPRVPHLWDTCANEIRQGPGDTGQIGTEQRLPSRGWEGCNFLSSCEPADRMGKALKGSGPVFKHWSGTRLTLQFTAEVYAAGSGRYFPSLSGGPHSQLEKCFGRETLRVRCQAPALCGLRWAGARAPESRGCSKDPLAFHRCARCVCGEDLSCPDPQPNPPPPTQTCSSCSPWTFTGLQRPGMIVADLL